MSVLQNSELRLAIEQVITTTMDRVMNRVLNTDPFIKEDHRSKKPLYAALVPDEIFKGSHFERRFVTPFGGIWEELAVVVGRHGMGSAKRHQKIMGNVPRVRLQRIQSTLDNLEHGRRRSLQRVQPDWNKELAFILSGGGELVPTTVQTDVLVSNVLNGQGGTERKIAFEIKAPLPNSDQTKVSKEKILKLYAMEPILVTQAYFALPYNPYGRKEDYRWSFPKRWFDMCHDPCVLIGDELWELLGGPGTYSALVEIVHNLGKEYHQQIYSEYLGIAPPEKDDEFVFQSVPSS